MQAERRMFAQTMFALTRFPLEGIEPKMGEIFIEFSSTGKLEPMAVYLVKEIRYESITYKWLTTFSSRNPRCVQRKRRNAHILQRASIREQTRMITVPMKRLELAPPILRSASHWKRSTRPRSVRSRRTNVVGFPFTKYSNQKSRGKKRQAHMRSGWVSRPFYRRWKLCGDAATGRNSSRSDDVEASRRPVVCSEVFLPPFSATFRPETIRKRFNRDPQKTQDCST